MIGPQWTWDETMEKPQGEKDMGTYKQAVYTKEQQERLGVDQEGNKVNKNFAGAIGPQWTWDETMEKLQGEKDMGTYKQAVYTKEQQERLGVDINGNKVNKNFAGAIGPQWT